MELFFRVFRGFCFNWYYDVFLVEAGPALKFKLHNTGYVFDHMSFTTPLIGKLLKPSSVFHSIRGKHWRGVSSVEDAVVISALEQGNPD